MLAIWILSDCAQFVNLQFLNFVIGMNREKHSVYRIQSTIQNFRYPLGVLEHMPCQQGGTPEFGYSSWTEIAIQIGIH